MANEHLRQAIHDAGLEPAELATQIGVDTKTVERWITGRTPYPRYRSQVARALNRDEHELWPDAATASQQPREASSPTEGRAFVYTNAGDPSAPDLRALLEQATSRVDLLDLTHADLLEDGPTLDLLWEAAKRPDCQIRILVSDPESVHLSLAEAERHPDRAHGIAQRSSLADNDLANQILWGSLEQHGVQLRRFVAPNYNSIFRVDEHMLVNLHLWGVETKDAPLLHLNRDANPQLFNQFAAHYDAIWNEATQPLN